MGNAINAKCRECKHYISYGMCDCTMICEDNDQFEVNTSGKLEKNEAEMVNHPSHYNEGIEAIEVIESHNLNFNLGNAIKYILRCNHKGTKKQDLEKAIWYIKREIEKTKGE